MLKIRVDSLKISICKLDHRPCCAGNGTSQQHGNLEVNGEGTGVAAFFSVPPIFSFKCQPHTSRHSFPTTISPLWLIPPSLTHRGPGRVFTGTNEGYHPFIWGVSSLYHLTSMGQLEKGRMIVCTTCFWGFAWLSQSACKHTDYSFQPFCSVFFP